MKTPPDKCFFHLIIFNGNIFNANMKAFPTIANEGNISRETIQMWKAEVFEYELKDALFLSTETENVLLYASAHL